jgi:hypothetical protein
VSPGPWGRCGVADFGLFGYLTVLASGLGLVFAGCAFVFVRRLEDRIPVPLGEVVGAHKAVLDKLRKRKSMSQSEIYYASQIISDSRSLLAYSIPATIFTIGCFYIVGCLEQLHGAKPSVRTFIGVLPMLGSTNLAVQLLRVARLKGRLPRAATADNHHLSGSQRRGRVRAGRSEVSAASSSSQSSS